MSMRRILLSTLGISLTVMIAWSAVYAGQSKPAESDQQNEKEVSKKKEASTQPASEATLGAVEKALISLDTIPPDSARQFTRQEQPIPERKGFDKRKTDQQKNDVAVMFPEDPVSRPNRLGLQHDDAIRHSVSSVPIGDDIRGEVPEGNNPSVRNKADADRVEYFESPTAYLVSPYYYDHRSRRLSTHSRRWNDYRYFDGQPGRYGYGMEGFGDDYAGQIYRFGFNQGYDRGRFEKTSDERGEAVLAHAGEHLEQGLQLFHKGRYHSAATAFQLAAETNQGDPAARLYAAHALFALGRYSDGLKYLRRAFELQPKIVFLNYDIRDDYGERADFDKQLEALEKALERSDRNIDRLIVAGYVYYYTNKRDKAYEVLAKASKISRREDKFIVRLMENAKPPDVMLDEIKAEKDK